MSFFTGWSDGYINLLWYGSRHCDPITSGVTEGPSAGSGHRFGLMFCEDSMNRNMIIWHVILLTVLLTACNSAIPPATVETINTISLKEYYPKLLAEAQKWRSDAYLDHARISLYQQGSDVISSNFFSLTEDHQSIGVYLLRDGTLSVQYFTYESIYPRKAIEDEDWKIDSQEALNLMLDQDGVNLIKSGNAVCSYLKLERFLPLDEQPVVWVLHLSDCSGTNTRSFYLDPITGLDLNLSKAIKPTRFPTPTP
jgi:hypothetical protein